jgi:copper(I)-binding protein
MPMRLRRLLVAFMACCAGFGALAADISVTQAWARATVPGQKAGGVFLRLDNKGNADRLLSARADVCEAVELHSMTMDGDVMRMRELLAIELPAGGSVELKPGGLHLMLLGLKSPLKEGSRFGLTLKFERSGELKVDVPVRSGAAAPGARH